MKRAAIAVVLIAAAVAFYVLRPSGAGTPTPVEPLVAVNPRIPGQDQAAGYVVPPEERAPGAVEAQRVAPKGQVPLIRPAQQTQPLKVLTPPDTPRGPVDKRGGPVTPDAKRQMEMVSYAFESLEEDVEECLKQWDGAAPGQAQEVMIAFEIDQDGLQKSWLEHEGDVPFGPRTCLANAVYGLDWSKIVDQPAMLTQRYTLTRDAGP